MTLPFESITVCSEAPVPLSLIVTVGATRYPLPGFVIITLVILPSVTTGVNTAWVALATPTNAKSSKVSIDTSHCLDTAVGAGSALNKLVKILSSTIKFSLSIRLVLSITCFNASARFTNQLCLGLLRAPYFCLGLNVGSGTTRICASYPIKLSYHFLMISALG